MPVGAAAGAGAPVVEGVEAKPFTGAALAYAVARLAALAEAERVVVTLGSSTRQFAVAAFVALALCRDARLLMPAIAYCLIM